MPEQEQPGSQPPPLSQDPLVELLLPDPTQGHPNVRVLAGYLGNSTQKENVRLYLTPALDVYLELPREAIMQSQSLVSDQNPLGGTLLWVKQDTDMVLHTRTNLRQRQAQFLGGNINMTGTPQTGTQGIARGNMANLSALAALPAQLNVDTWNSCVICPWTTPFCIRHAPPDAPVE